MQFYKIEMYIEMNMEKEVLDGRRGRQADREFGRSLTQKCNKYTEKMAGKGLFFLNSVIEGFCVFGMIARGRMDVEMIVRRFIRENKLQAEDINQSETTLQNFLRLLNEASRNGYIYDDDEVLVEYGLDNIAEERRVWGSSGYISEKIICDKERDSIYMAADSYFTKETFLPELDRIYCGSVRRNIIGHPVDYIIESDDERTRNGMAVLLLQALYSVGRIENRRYSLVDLTSDLRFSKKTIDELYKTSIGGTVIINIEGRDNGEEDDRVNGDFYFLSDLGDVIRRYYCSVLTVICMPRECKNIKMKLFETIGNCSFVEIKENQSTDEMAVEYLKKRAKEYKVRCDKKLTSSLEKGRGYLTPELNEIFDLWYGEKLKTGIYRQYKDISKAKSEIKESQPKGNAYDELMGMIGLRSAKDMISLALDNYKAHSLFKDKGMVDESLCYHMIFTGNPGTAKTTVARLFARILKDNDVLSKGHIVEVGRGDLVGRYVGWTAPTIKKKFQQAIGGVLFIDEAYSLVDDRNGSFGDEAINTIVQEMENHRGDVIVIFAGYTDKMEEFLDKNPGLRSRIAHYINFEDYNSDELCLIAEHIAKKRGLVLGSTAKAKIREVMYKAAQYPDFGNGRYARNVIEKARMLQSSRLVRMDYETVTPIDVKTIIAEDIESPRERETAKRMKIGFSA